METALEWASETEEHWSCNAIEDGFLENKTLPEDPKTLRKIMVESLGLDDANGVWGGKGIYVWYWRPGAGSDAWPLYVGKSQRGRSSFGSRMKTHIRHALNGKDFIYSPEESWSRSRLVPKHDPRVEAPGDNHMVWVTEQFARLSALLLPMKPELAEEIAGVAEGVLLEAILRIHEDAGRMRGEKYDTVMNSPAKAHNASQLGRELDSIKAQLCAWMREPAPI